MSDIPLQYLYARGKLGEAIETLVVAPGDVRERVAMAMNPVITLTVADFPENLRADWKWIDDQVTRYGPLQTPDGSITLGAIANTMHRIRRATASKIAMKFWTLYSDMNRFIDIVGK